MFRRTKTKLEKKDEPPGDSNQKSTKNEFSAGLGKMLGIKKNQELDADSSISIKNDPVELQVSKNKPVFDTDGKNKDKISSLIRLIKASNEKVIAPKLDLSTGIFTYPLLEEIGEDSRNIQFLENLSSESIDLLEKIVYERIAVCPQHPDSLEANVRLYCPKCASMDIEKLHLFEHKVCGYISETKNFLINNSIMECPSCKKPIKDRKKELRIPAMWYNCHSCKEKFDDVVIKMYCRKFNHDFDTNVAGTVSIPGFILKDSKSSSNYDSSLISNIKDLLSEHGFISEENHSVKGKSGHYHNIDLIATKSNIDTIFTYILKSENTIDESEINTKIIQVLDCNPTKTIIIGQLSDRAKSMASKYDISIIDSYEKDIVLSSFSKILSDSFTTENLENDEQSLEIARLIEKQRLEEERLVERRKLEEERLEAEKIEAARLEAEVRAERQRLEEERQAEKQILEAERLAERKRIEEERKKVERIEAERLAERKKLESEIVAERKRLEAERLAEKKRLVEEQIIERKKLEEERFADRLILEAEKKRLEEERKKVEKLEAERQRLEEEKARAERLAAEQLEAERKRLEEERKQAEKRAKILKKLEETENQLKALKSSFDSGDEKEE
jgi:hypothetical protein